tara:strand:+ start:3970 stop:4602 length:633 start_codon:yes stop_codon:yes gene_type:complete
MAEYTSPTRSELLKLNSKRKLAEKGHDLLKRKRDALIRIFFERIKEYKALKKDTLGGLESAFKTLRIAEGVSGVNRVKGLAFSSDPSFEIMASTKNLMGVKVPSFKIHEKPVQINASMIGTSFYVDEARKEFIQLVPDLVRLSEVEQIIFTLAEEIKKTKRRVNSLEYIKIPELIAAEKEIKDKLAEIERESFVRLKNVKQKIERDTVES